MPFVMVSVFDNIAQYAPGFKDSIVGYDILTPPDLERIFGLTGGVSQRLFTRCGTPVTATKTLSYGRIFPSQILKVVISLRNAYSTGYQFVT